MTLADAHGRKLDLGRVFGDTFAVIRRQAVPLLGVTFIVGYLPGVLSSVLRMQMMGTTSRTDPFAAMSNPFSLVLAPINLLLSAFLLACLLQIAVADLERRNISLPDVLRRAAGKILPVVGALILVFLGCMIGITLFIVPGIILALMWAVALPSTVAETSNPLRALGRSRALTKGNRWRIFGLALLAWLVFFALELVIVGAAGGMAALARGPSLGLGAIALISLISLIIYVVGAVGSAALYVQLRELKGAGGESVAQVFA